VYFERPLVAACICAVPDTAMQLVVFRMFLILVSPHGIPRIEDCLAARAANRPFVIPVQMAGQPADGHVQVTDLALARVPVTKMLQPLVLGAGPVVHAVGAVVQLKRPIVREVRVMSEC
jgi:hypothetical protein